MYKYCFNLLYFLGGQCTEVANVQRRSMYIGGQCTEEIYVQRGSMYRGGQCTEVVNVQRCSIQQGYGHCAAAADADRESQEPWRPVFPGDRLLTAIIELDE